MTEQPTEDVAALIAEARQWLGDEYTPTDEFIKQGGSIISRLVSALELSLRSPAKGKGLKNER